MTVSLRYAARSDIGLVRQSNQDSGYAGPHLMLLCDGMGGPAGGDIASATAVEALVGLDEDSHQASEMLGLLRDAVSEAHEELIRISTADPELVGLGTTCIGVMRSGNKLAMVHVGDSRAYLLRDGDLTQVTTDHTFVEYLVEAGRLTREQARRHPQRSVLLRVLGDTEGDVQLDESIREAVPGDRWLLCSDGLSGPVSAETIAEVLRTAETPDDAAEQLIDLALRAGGPDNVTAVVFDVVEDDPQKQTDPQVVGSAALRRARAAGSDDETTQALPVEGSTPASRAAALVAAASAPAVAPSQDEAIAEEAERQRAESRRHRRRTVITTLVLAALVVAALVLGYRWTQTKYYVATYDGKVAIYQGIPQTIGPVALSHVVETYDSPSLVSLDDRIRERLDDTVEQDSLSEAEAYVADTVSTHLSDSAAATATPSASTTPSATATATATSKKTKG